MKKYLLIPLCCLLIITCTGNGFAHPVAPPDCYTDYKNKGDSLSKTGNYDLAIKQYQAAKYCLQATPQQKTILDNLIADMEKKKASQKKAMPARRF